MENASKALLIAGGILISMLVISIGVYLFATYSDSTSSYEQTLQASEIQKFNNNFLKFEGREDITIHEIITLVNFTKQYEQQTGTHIQVIVSGTGDLKSTSEDIITLIEENSTVELEAGKITNKYFECKVIPDTNYFTEGPEKGKIKKIEFKET